MCVCVPGFYIAVNKLKLHRKQIVIHKPEYKIGIIVFSKVFVYFSNFQVASAVGLLAIVVM